MTKRKIIPIVVAAYNRSHTLQRLLTSLLNAEYPFSVPLIISIDGGDFADVQKIANEMQWPNGVKNIIIHKEHLGLRKHMLSCADLSQEYDGIVLLEDDLYVSRGFYYFAIRAAEHYHTDENIAGISLYSQQVNETAMFPFEPLQDETDVFFLQVPSSWGLCCMKEQWKHFKIWYENRHSSKSAKNILLPGNLHNWPKTSWKKYFFKYLIETDKYFVYPKVSHTTNFGDEGTHHKGNKAFQVPLQYMKNEFSFKSLNESIAVYDAFCEILPDRLNQLVPELNQYDYAVDLYAAKPLAQLKCEYILTTKSCTSDIYRYGKEIKPLVANVIERIPGDRIFLSPKAHCKDLTYSEVLAKCIDRQELLYHYSLMKSFHLTPQNALMKEFKEKEHEINSLRSQLECLKNKVVES